MTYIMNVLKTPTEMKRRELADHTLDMAMRAKHFRLDTGYRRDFNKDVNYFPVSIDIDNADAFELSRATDANKTGLPRQPIDMAIADAGWDATKKTAALAAVVIPAALTYAGGAAASVAVAFNNFKERTVEEKFDDQVVGTIGVITLAAGIFLATKVGKLTEKWRQSMDMLDNLKQEKPHARQADADAIAKRKRQLELHY